jgi:hypothetical protein
MHMPKVLKDLWEDKPMLIVTVVGLGVLLYVLYKSNSSNVVAPAASDATGQASGGGPSGTFVEESYSLYAPTTSTTTTSAATPIAAPVLPSIVSPAGKGKLKGTVKTAGKGDTNFGIYTVPAGSTLLSLAHHANWGNDTVKLANYRNNLQILQAAGVNTANPLAPVPTGLRISV